MKKVFVGFFVFVVCLLVAGYLVRHYVGDVGPAILPHVSLTKYTPVPVKRGKPLNSPLHVPDGFQIGVFADGLGGLRAMTFSPSGLLLVSDTGNGKVYAMPDKNKDGIADDVITVLTGLRRPHGLAFYKDKLYVAQETGVYRYIWAEEQAAGGQLAVARLENTVPIISLPEGGRHFTRSIVFDKDGLLYISVGSTCDVCEEKDPRHATVMWVNSDGSTPGSVEGLRNAPFLTLNQKTNQVWGTEMGRDFLGDNAPPDEINIIKPGYPKADLSASPAIPLKTWHYGWPYCYGNQVYDSSFGRKSADFCKTTIPPIYQIPAHSAPLGLTFIDSAQFHKDWQGDLLVAYHGSWNRSTPTGYKVVRMHVRGNTITGEEDFLTGFLQDGTATGRPVDVLFDKDGSLYISDDKTGKIYIVSKK
jgi:glucose/arabinose dehydrogenase